MGASADRIAVEVTSRADVSGLRAARDGLDTLRKSTDDLKRSEDALDQETKKVAVDREQFNRLLREYSGDVIKAGQEAARLAQAEREVAKAVAPTTRELEQQTTVLREQATTLRKETTEALTSLEKRIGSTSVAVIFGMESMVRGFASGEGGIRAALRSISVLAATTLGPAGIAVSALIAFGDAAVEQFTRAGRAAEALRKKVDEEMKRLVNAQDWAAIQKQAQEAFEGTPAEHFKDGVKALREELKRLQTQLTEVEAKGPLIMSLGIGAGTAGDPAAARIRASIAEVQKAIADKQAIIDRAAREEASGENIAKSRGGIAPFTIEASGRSALKQLTLDMQVYQSELADVLRFAPKLRDVQIGIISQDQLSQLQLLEAEEGRVKLALQATNLTYSERIRLQRELESLRDQEAEARKVIDIDPKVIEKQSKEAMDAYKKSRQGTIDDDVAEEEKKRVGSAKRIAAEMKSVAISAVEEGIRAHKSLAKIASQALLEPLERYLEGVAVQEGIDALKSLAKFDFFGAARHTAVAVAALAAATKVAAIGGFGGSGQGGGAYGGGSAGTFTPNQQGGAGAGGDVHLTIQTVDPLSQTVLNEVIYHINRSGILKNPVHAPSRRSYPRTGGMGPMTPGPMPGSYVT